MHMRHAFAELGDPAMPVAHVFAEADVGDDDQRGQLLLQPADRALHHALGRVQAGTVVDIVSSVDDNTWTSTISSREASALARAEFQRPSFLFVLAQRAIVAHGGEVIDHPSSDGPLLLSIRLPLSLHAE